MTRRHAPAAGHFGLIPESEFYTVEEASRLTGRSPQMIGRWIRQGRVPAELGSKWPHPMLLSAGAVLTALQMPRRYGPRHPDPLPPKKRTISPLAKVPASRLEEAV